MNASEVFVENRSLLFSIGYDMLGVTEDTEDLVQETYLNWISRDLQEIKHPKAYLAKIMTNKCIDHLNRLKQRREEYVGQWLPEPLVNDTIPDAFKSVELYHALSIGMLVMLEKLTPKERAVFLLNEIFSFDYDEIADIIGESRDNCRQLFSRARKHLEGREKRFTIDLQVHERVLKNFLNACQNGDMDELISMLKEDIQLLADGDGKVLPFSGGKLTAVLNPIVGKMNVARFLVNTLTKLARVVPDFHGRMVIVNGTPSLVSYSGTMPISVTSIDIVDDQVQSVFVQTNPGKLKKLLNLRERNAGGDIRGTEGSDETGG